MIITTRTKNRTVEDWTAFMEGAAKHFGVSEETLYKIVLFFDYRFALEELEEKKPC
jgi:hypothetical protein